MKYRYTYTKKLQNKIKELNLDSEDNNELLSCLYLNGCSGEDCARLFNFTLDSIINYLKYEQIYGYQICQVCEKLKERNDVEFEKQKGQKNTNVCTECKKLNRKEYYQRHIDRKREYVREYNKKYNKNNKERIQEQHKKYYDKNKEYIKEYSNSLASEEKLQKLELYEEVKGNQIKCRYCGDWYIPTIIEVQNRLKGISKSDISFIYCSPECKTACPIYGQKLYPKTFKKASSREVNPVLRQIVFERDQYTCQRCFKHKAQLNCAIHCHHINPHVESPIEANDPDNCITLCEVCHKEVHEIPGCGYVELRCSEDDLEVNKI